MGTYDQVSFGSNLCTIEVAGTTFQRVITQKMRKVLKFTDISHVGIIVFLIYCIWHLSHWHPFAPLIP